MKNNDMCNFLDTQEQMLSDEKSALVETTRILINQYWDWFLSQNHRIFCLRKVGVTSQKTSKIAPVLEIKTSRTNDEFQPIENVYKLWKNHNPAFRKNLKDKFGKKINASKPLQTHDSKSIVNILRTRCTGDATRAIEFESQLHQIRTALRGLHQALVRLRSAKPTILKKQLRISHDTTKDGENNNDD